MNEPTSLDRNPARWRRLETSAGDVGVRGSGGCARPGGDGLARGEQRSRPARACLLRCCGGKVPAMLQHGAASSPRWAWSCCPAPAGGSHAAAEGVEPLPLLASPVAASRSPSPVCFARARCPAAHHRPSRARAPPTPRMVTTVVALSHMATARTHPTRPCLLRPPRARRSRRSRARPLTPPLRLPPRSPAVRIRPRPSRLRPPPA